MIGFLSISGLVNHLVFMSDEAGQFNVFSHGLCWVHVERKLTDLISNSDEQLSLIENTLTAFWEFFGQLKQYKQAPDETVRIHLRERYDQIFEPSTSWKTFNKVFISFQNNREQLLKVLDRPEIPLTNNESERDIRSIVTKRKVSGGHEVMMVEIVETLFQALPKPV